MITPMLLLEEEVGEVSVLVVQVVNLLLLLEEHQVIIRQHPLLQGKEPQAP